MSESHIPEGYHSITPSLTVKDASYAMDFYAKAFGAVELYRLTDPRGKVMHAEFQIGNSRLMISDEFPEMGAMAPEIGKGALFMIYLSDVDAAYYQAIGVGASAVAAPAEMFWGDRTARVNDPFGYRWTLAAHVRDVSPEEMARAAAEWASGG